MRIIVLALTCCMGSVSAASDEASFARADEAARSGNLAEMQRIYESILEQEPRNIRALSGKAAALAWQRRYAESQATYASLLDIEPTNADARTGLGYAYAWDGKYADAFSEFNRVLAAEPRNVAARKGIAWTHLWAGEHANALEALDIAADLAPGDAEIWEATGHAHVAQHANRQAILDYERALVLDPGRDSARLALAEAYRSAPALELSAHAGTTSGVGSGLRRVEAGHWTSTSTRLFARFDNTLGLDNASIADRNLEAPSYFAGIGHRFANGFGLQVEGGYRDLDGSDQRVGTVQGVYETNRGILLRLGGQFGDHSDGYTDTLYFGGFNFPVGDRLRIEPTVYISESGPDADTEWRSVINTEYRLDTDISIGGFFGTGRIEASDAAFEGDTLLAGAWLRWDFDGRYALTLSSRHEQMPFDDLSIFEIGFVYRLPGNGGTGR